MEKRFLRVGCLLTALALLAAGLTGCRDSFPDTMDLTVSLEEGTLAVSSFEGIPDPTITEYRISGSGPRDSSFEVYTKTTHTVIEGIYVGNWIITAEGLNEEGNSLIGGSISKRLTLEDAGVTLELSPLEGDGTVDIGLLWNPGELDVIMLRVIYRRTDCEEGKEITTYATSGDTGGYLQDSFPAGDYIMTFQVIDNEWGMVGNTTKAVNVYKDTITRGQIFIETELPSSPQGISIIDASAPPLTGTLIGAPFVIYENIPLHLMYLPDNPDLIDYNDLTLEWYLNGQKIRTIYGALDEMIIPERGFHQLDVLAYSSRQGSLASSSIKFAAHDISLTKDLMLVQSLEDGVGDSRLRLVSDLAVTPQGTVITASKGENLLQIFGQDHDGTLSSRYILEDSTTTPLRGVRAAASSPDGSFICVLSEYDASISIYTYSPHMQRFVHAYSLSGSLLPGGGSPVGTLSDAVISMNGTDIYVSDQGSDEIYHLKWDGAQLHYYGSAVLTGSPGLSSPRKLALDPSGSYLASTNMNNSSLQIFSIGVDGQLTRSQAFSYSSDGTMGISQINNAVFANDGTLFTTSNNFLCHFGYDGSFHNTYRAKEGDFTDCYMAGLRTAVVDEYRSKVYVGSVTSRGITVFERNADETLTFSSFTPCAPIHQMAMDPTGTFLYAISTSGHALLVFDIR